MVGNAEIREEGLAYSFQFLSVGLLVRFPDAGSQSVCSHCGANIYANDVFKKIKDLIG
jgi:hypothetical protein